MDMRAQREYNTGVPKAESGLDCIESKLQAVSERMARAIDGLRCKSAPVSLQLPASGRSDTVGRSLAPAFCRLRETIETLDCYAEQIESITLGLDI